MKTSRTKIAGLILAPIAIAAAVLCPAPSARAHETDTIWTNRYDGPGNGREAGSPQNTQPIAWNDLGAKAAAQYSGDGLAVNTTAKGARLRCVFQKLEGEVSEKGLSLSSTAPGSSNASFRVQAAAIGRECGMRRTLSSTGNVETTAGFARFIRAGLIEEYSVSVDGLRQDFVLPERPPGQGALRVDLRVDGATAEVSSDGVRLLVENSSRKLNYHRLRATDATGRELAAWMEAVSRTQLAVTVEDGGAVYPVLIDPTFSDANWTSMGGFPGLGDARVKGQPGQADAAGAVAVDGSGNLYVGGSFSIAGDVFATNIAKWDGISWSALDAGITAIEGYPFYGGSVNALAVSGTNLYAGGYFTTAGGVAATNIAKWDGSTWSTVGSGLNSNVFALTVSGSDVYAGGWFTIAGGIGATNIAKWNGSSWSALGSGMNGTVRALAASGSNLFAGGTFTKAGGTAATNIAKWNGSSWSSLGSGMNGAVRGLAISGTDLYAGGQFTRAGSTAATNIAKWNGSSWAALGLGVNKQVLALTVSGSNLYVGGEFSLAGGIAAYEIAKWNGSSWSALGSGVNGPWVSALASSGTNVYAGGHFAQVGGIGAESIAKWNGSSWSALGTGMSGGPQVLAVFGKDLYAGGQFSTSGGAKSVAKWDGSGWSGLGFGFAPVNALAMSGSDLYVGGRFVTAGGAPAKSIAKWNGSSWSALGSGIHDASDPFGLGDVYAMASAGTNLYVGGYFTMAGTAAAASIAKWNGSSWSALGSGIDFSVYSLAVLGSNLYAGGWFMTAGGNSANSIAKWDGSSWSTLGSGIRGNADSPSAVAYAYALAVLGTNLYVGGVFTTAGGSAADNIAKWNGNNWSTLGSGIGGFFPYVNALAVSGNDLYAGGLFNIAGGTDASRVAKWNGSSWSALGSGTGGRSPSVNALAASGSELYVGGTFSMAGGKIAGHVAKARIGTVAKSIAASSGNALIQFSGVTGYEYDVQRATTLNPPIIWTTVNVSPLSPGDDGSFTFIDANAPAGMAYYRAVIP